MSGTLTSRAFGLLRQVVFNNLYPDLAKDVFNVAFRVPNLFREILAEGAITNALVPLLSELSPEKKSAFLRHFFGLLLAANLVVVGLIELFAPFFADLLVAEGSSLPLAQVTLAIRVVAPFLLAVSLAAFFAAILQAEERFLAPAFAPVVFNLTAIALMLAFPKTATGVALAFVAGGFAQAAVNLFFLRDLGLGFALELTPELRRALSLMSPFALTTTARQAVNIVLTAILTAFPTAAVTGFYNAEMIYLMLLGLFAVSPATALFSRLANVYAQYGENDVYSFKVYLEEAAAQVGVLLLFASAYTFALAPWLVAALFAWSPGFSPANFAFSTAALRALALALLPWGVYTILARAFYAQKRPFFAAGVSVFVFLLNALGYYLLAPGGMFVLNLATFFAGVVGVLVLAWVLSREGWIEPKALFTRLWPYFPLALGSALVAWFFAWVAGPPASAWASLFPLAAGAAGGFLTYRLLESFGYRTSR